MDPIFVFEGKYHFLSNFHSCEVVWDGIVWKHSEGAYQAAKSLDREVRLAMADLDAHASKQSGKRVLLRPDWDKVKDGIMLEIVRAKFQQNPDLKGKLLATDDAHLEEGNWWKDRYWGVCPARSGNGLNKLGKILMIVREELK
jgi:ribA/ribD-fused uncharacterized protein